MTHLDLSSTFQSIWILVWGIVRVAGNFVESFSWNLEILWRSFVNLANRKRFFLIGHENINFVLVRSKMYPIKSVTKVSETILTCAAGCCAYCTCDCWTWWTVGAAATCWTWRKVQIKHKQIFFDWFSFERHQSMAF